jgi:hypothetical protein
MSTIPYREVLLVMLCVETFNTCGGNKRTHTSSCGTVNYISGTKMLLTMSEASVSILVISSALFSTSICLFF